MEEIKDINIETTPVSDFEKLPYLNAVIKESLRLAYGVSLRLPRVSPDKEMVYEQWTIPKGTSVSMTTVLIHLNPGVFADPSAFRPERWLEDKDGRLDKYMVAFGSGSRICLGINLAWMELYLIVVGFWMKFGRVEGGLRMELFETDESDVEIFADGFFPLMKPESKGIRAQVKSAT